MQSNLIYLNEKTREIEKPVIEEDFHTLPLPPVCKGCSGSNCFNCACVDERIRTAKMNTLIYQRKSKIREIYRMFREVSEIELQIMILEGELQ